MIYWAPFLHIYQPPTQMSWVLKKVCEESYRPVLKVLKNHPHARVTLNINGVLLEMLLDHGYQDIIDDIRFLSKRGRLELVGSSKYHAILPLLDPEEALRQVDLNLETQKNFFGKAFSPRGFFPPEMCYSRQIVGPLEQRKIEWILISGIACNNAWPQDHIYRISGSSVRVFFRDDIVSNKISFDKITPSAFLSHLQGFTANKKGRDIYVITAMDGETFGHHIPKWDTLFLDKLFQKLKAFPYPYKKRFRVVTISELLDLFPSREEISPIDSSWSSTVEEIHRGVPFSLWNEPHNNIHQLLWQHLNLCHDMVKRLSSMELKEKEAADHARTARLLLDQSYHSCQFWWASRRPMWNVNFIHKGLSLQEETALNAFRSARLAPLGEEMKRQFQQDFTRSAELANHIRRSLVET